MLYYYILLACVFLAILAQVGISKAYNQYSQVENAKHITGAQAAQEFLNANGVYDVDISVTNGVLSDHYDPTKKTIFLSPRVYREDSVASVAIACHEAGHALQHADNYTALIVRNKLLPAVYISSRLCWILIIIGILLSSFEMMYIGIAMFALLAIFQLVTLPVEFNASARALKYVEGGTLTVDETVGAKKVLKAAALTYVVALITSLVQLFRLILILGGGRRR